MAIKYQILNGIKISDGTTTRTLPRPSGFTVEREGVYAGEITSCTGQYYADYIGWKYADMNLQWDILQPAELDFLINLPAVVSLSWEDSTGSTVTESVRITKRASTGSRYTKNGRQYWKKVSMGVSFNGTHSN